MSRCTNFPLYPFFNEVWSITGLSGRRLVACYLTELYRDWFSSLCIGVPYCKEKTALEPPKLSQVPHLTPST
uniref:Uncharacterized protein n=1 Tax=Aegilops tauschii subsp. strangulata TaxID=200361 RepID=A0A453CK54_AEGTS